MEKVITENGTLWNGSVVPAICFDLDGTVRRSKTGDFISGPEDIELFPGAEEAIQEYVNMGWLICAVSNQGGVAHGYKTHVDVGVEIQATLDLFTNQPFHLIEACFHEPSGSEFPYNKRSLLRKPDIGMLCMIEVEAFKRGYLIDWDSSIFVGDRPEDEQCAKNANIRFIHADEFFQRGKFAKE